MNDTTPGPFEWYDANDICNICGHHEQHHGRVTCQLCYVKGLPCHNSSHAHHALLAALPGSSAWTRVQANAALEMAYSDLIERRLVGDA
jgi:hypothetical protein